MPAVQDKLIELGVGGGAGSFSITVRLCCHLVCKYSTTVKKKGYNFKLDTSGWSFIILAVHTWGVLCYKKVLRHWPAISLVGESALVCCT